MDDFGDAARVYMAKQVLNDLVFICDDVWNNLLLLAVNKKLHHLAEVAGED